MCQYSREAKIASLSIWQSSCKAKKPISRAYSGEERRRRRREEGEKRNFIVELLAKRSGAEASRLFECAGDRGIVTSDGNERADVMWAKSGSEGNTSSARSNMIPAREGGGRKRGAREGA